MSETHHQKRHVAHHAIKHAKHHWMTIAFLGGFALDNITMNRVDQVFDDLLLTFYVVLAMTSLALLYASTAQKIEGEFGNWLKKITPITLQYSYGGLLSGMLIFYGRSGSWFHSWPYLLIIIAAIYGNETIEDKVPRLLYNLASLFVGLLSYVVLMVPVLTGWMGVGSFIASGLLAACIMYWFVRLLRWIVPRFISMHIKSIIFTLGSIYVTLNFLYFTNIIPPIPLSLKELGIFHSVVHFSDGTYQLKYEKGAWYQPLKQSDDIFHTTSGGNIFCFARVYAPTKIQTDIYHRWDYYDSKQRKWIEYFKLSYPIRHVSLDGYRGYTLIENYKPGKWRCTVETGRGQILGSETFWVDTNDPPAPLVTRTE